MTATEVCYPPIKEEHLPTDLPRNLWGPRLPHPYEAVEDALERVNIKKGTSYEMKDAISFIVRKSYVVC